MSLKNIVGVEIEMDKKGAASLNCVVRAEIEMNGGVETEMQPSTRPEGVARRGSGAAGHGRGETRVTENIVGSKLKWTKKAVSLNCMVRAEIEMNDGGRN